MHNDTIDEAVNIKWAVSTAKLLKCEAIYVEIPAKSIPISPLPTATDARGTTTRFAINPPIETLPKTNAAIGT
jgi:hypothetical protein